MLMRKKQQNNYEMKERERDVCVIGQCKCIKYHILGGMAQTHVLFILYTEYVLRIRKYIFLYIIRSAV